MQNMDWYRVFVCVAEQASLRAAAEALHVSPSAVSQTLKNLEDHLNARLFLRSSRGMRLSPEGEVLFSGAQKALKTLEGVEARLKDFQGLSFGEFRLGAGDAVCRACLLPAIRSFTLQYPQVNMEIYNRTSTGLLELLKAGRIDLALLSHPFEAADFYINPYKSLAQVFVGSKHLLQRNFDVHELTAFESVKVSWDFLAESNLLLLSKASNTRKILDSFLGNFITSPLRIKDFESEELMLDLARIDFGLACVLDASVKKMPVQELFVLDLPQKLPDRQVSLVYPKDARPAVRAFIEILELQKS